MQLSASIWYFILVALDYERFLSSSFDAQNNDSYTRGVVATKMNTDSSDYWIKSLESVA